MAQEGEEEEGEEVKDVAEEEEEEEEQILQKKSWGVETKTHNSRIKAGDGEKKQTTERVTEGEKQLYWKKRVGTVVR